MDEVIVCTCLDKRGSPFEVAACTEKDRAALVEMYECFTPKGVSQGLPPTLAETRREWVDRLCAQGENFLAWCGERVVGHACLIPDLARGDAEFLIFVSQEYRNRGLGAELTRMAVEKARALGLAGIWLTVEAFNFRAIALYKKFGFEFCDECDKERTMILKLTPGNVS